MEERSRQLEYYYKNKAARLDYYKQNREARIAYQVNYQREKRQNDEQYKIACTLRSRLWAAINSQGSEKHVSHVKDLGCSIDDLIAHLEHSAYLNYGIINFNWEEDYSGDVWHIDHIRPLSSFDLTDPEEQLKAVHYTNLQLLTKEDNMEKGNKYEPTDTGN